ncbi:ribonuclease BN (tRNA processing enzyme) [Thalassospira sp. MBR-102]|jgi:ribonuclease BN (tRNA processing enzyme)|uniref:Beta-lactamase superfamily hydrolase n=2 Tax=Thalassospira TaxID=168934 RepID=A0AB72UJH3_9PROT|nr:MULTISPECIES: MBL fold metallo-hydrolase [Thalassospira]AJD54260.1 beta-lactamase superfamily hydrolase [Thalassospira xiamenensis M-5 = DSM 17429]KEO57862.1 beta-lactamase [Thalassospira permensis NBRC 106175]MBR9779408.1 ribonuclease Z [Rhodospirillales bacterium]MBR9817036.1 ribonuclease Z [Rhodospirillales bacterium]
MSSEYMRIDVLGVGEAFDPAFENSSVVVSANGYRLMIDCGATVPGLLMRKFPDPDAIDAIYFTHMHPDHVFGLVPVMLNWRDDGRSKPIHIIATPAVRNHLEKIMELGFAGLGSAWPFEIIWHAVPETTQIGPFETKFARSDHSVQNHAILLRFENKGFAYSGDGNVTADTTALFTAADLVFQETYLPKHDPKHAAHCDLETVLQLASDMPGSRFWLYHIKRDVRREIAELLRENPQVRVAVPGEVIEIR